MDSKVLNQADSQKQYKMIAGKMMISQDLVSGCLALSPDFTTYPLGVLGQVS